jgi:hypothetical protein
MAEIDWLLLSLFELLLVSSLLSIFLLTLNLRRKKRDRGAVQQLINEIKEAEGKRQSETQEIFRHRYGIQGEALESLVTDIDRQEKAFYQRLINLYLQHDTEAMATLHLAFQDATEPYRSMEIPQADTEVVPDQGETQSVELERLQQENARLSQELAISKDTLGRMLTEYASMYTGGNGEVLDKEKMLQMFQAEAIAQAAASEPSADESMATEAGSLADPAEGEDVRSDNDGTAMDAENEPTSMRDPGGASDETGLTEPAPNDLEQTESGSDAEPGAASESPAGDDVPDQPEPEIDADALDELLSLDSDPANDLEPAPAELDEAEAGRQSGQKAVHGC